MNKYLFSTRSGFASVTFKYGIALTFLCMALSSYGQDVVSVDKTFIPGNEKPIPVSVSGFTGEAMDVIKFDLYVQGFSFVGLESAQYIINGSNNGNLIGRAMDGINKSLLVNKSYAGANLRRQAHAFVEDFLKSIGRKGIESSKKVAFKVDTGSKSEIYIGDFDGNNAQSVTRDNNLVAAPVWIPGKLGVLYTSYRLGNPSIFLHDLSSGQRSAVARYPGSNMSPAPSPDGSKVAMTLSKSGAVELWVSNLDGSGLKQLTRSKDEESSPCWSPDGQWICFATRSAGRRFLSKVPAAGGNVQRISTSGISNPSEPDWSPDGKWIVFTAHMGSFEICVVPAGGGTATVLVSGEDPAWASNSRTVIYARRSGGSRSLSLLDVPTKQFKDVSRISVSGSKSQPSWAK